MDIVDIAVLVFRGCAIFLIILYAVKLAIIEAHKEIENKKRN